MTILHRTRKRLHREVNSFCSFSKCIGCAIERSHSLEMAALVFQKQLAVERLSSLRSTEWRKSGTSMGMDCAGFKLAGTKRSGGTHQEAIENLKEVLENIRRRRAQMPRPGTEFPMEIASSMRVNSNPELRDQFIEDVLGFDPNTVFISDETTLDLGDETHVAELQQKILNIYGVDVSDLKAGFACETLERIQSSSRESCKLCVTLRRKRPAGIDSECACSMLIREFARNFILSSPIERGGTRSPMNPPQYPERRTQK